VKTFGVDAPSMAIPSKMKRLLEEKNKWGEFKKRSCTNTAPKFTSNLIQDAARVT